MCCVMLLLEQNGYTALHRAANGGFVDVVKALVASKANLTVLDKVGCCFLLALRVSVPFTCINQYLYTVTSERCTNMLLIAISAHRTA
jgi:ankyrin repeat protein